MNNKNKCVMMRKNQIAVELVDMGYQIIKLEINKKRPTKTVFFFKDENNIREVIEQLKIKYWED